jgi:predicted nucleotidyltransferase/DNA-binding XRE family transcriptional regulator
MRESVQPQRRIPVPIDAAELIREARLRACLTQVELAERAGVTQSVISTYENARREPSFSVLQRLLLAAGFALRVQLEPTVAAMSLRDRVEEHRAELVATLGDLGGRNVRLFGSVARGDDGPESDVDLMVDLEPGLGLFTLMRMQDAAERILGAAVDVVAADGLRAGSRRTAMRDAVPL